MFKLPIEFFHSGAIVSLSRHRHLAAWGTPEHLAFSELMTDQPAFYFSDFFLNNPRPWTQYKQWRVISTDELKAQFIKVANKNIDECPWSFIDEILFYKTFNELKKLIEEGELQKGVPYIFAHSPAQMNARRLKFSLKRAAQTVELGGGYLYGQWRFPDGILGITPELLFSHHMHFPKSVQTMALAGTSSLKKSKEEFYHNPKERHEHDLVVQGICEALKPLGSTQTGEVQLLQFPRLMHLMTPIELSLNRSFNFEELVKCLHPTPALGAFPVARGRQWLKAIQQHTPRNFYGAPIGFVFSQEEQAGCFVGIRNVQWDIDGMKIGAGCGVVKQSVFENEWNEIQLKINAIRDQFGIQNSEE